MQQTQTYKLNLVEPSDPFTPDALNRNTQKIEDAMVIHEGVVDKRMDGLEDRIVVLEAKHIAYGSGQMGVQNGASWIYNLGFAPKVIVYRKNGGAMICAREQGDGELGFRDNGFVSLTGNLASFLAVG